MEGQWIEAKTGEMWLRPSVWVEKAVAVICDEMKESLKVQLIYIFELFPRW